MINLFGAPCAGKSVGAAYVFAQLKMKGINCELITECAKDKIWENNSIALNCQEYIFGEQSFRLKRCVDKVDILITDSPLLLSIIFNSDRILGDSFNYTVLNVFNSYNNLNYLICRTHPYSTIGRSQTMEEADALGDKIEEFLIKYNIPYIHGVGDKVFYDYIVSDVLNKIGGNI